MTVRTEEFLIDPESKEMQDLEKFLDTIQVERTENKLKFRISYNRRMLIGNSKLRHNLWLFLVWFYFLTDAKEEFEHEQAKNGKPEYAR